MCVSPKKTINAARFLCYFLMGNWHQFPHLTIFTRRTFVDFNFIIHFFLSLFHYSVLVPCRGGANSEVNLCAQSDIYFFVNKWSIIFGLHISTHKQQKCDHWNWEHNFFPPHVRCFHFANAYANNLESIGNRFVVIFSQLNSNDWFFFSLFIWMKLIVSVMAVIHFSFSLLIFRFKKRCITIILFHARTRVRICTELVKILKICV